MPHNNGRENHRIYKEKKHFLAINFVMYCWSSKHGETLWGAVAIKHAFVPWARGPWRPSGSTEKGNAAKCGWNVVPGKWGQRFSDAFVALLRYKIYRSHRRSTWIIFSVPWHINQSRPVVYIPCAAISLSSLVYAPYVIIFSTALRNAPLWV